MKSTLFPLLTAAYLTLGATTHAVDSYQVTGVIVELTDTKIIVVKGEQKERGGSDYVRLDGTITEVNAKDFKFDGVIEIQISYINGGKPCKRTGEMTFAITQKRKYWRLQQMDNPCDEAADYVDIYFRK